MHDPKALCEKIRMLYPDIGACGINVNVAWDNDQKAWVVELKHKCRQLKTFLEDADADLCMSDTQCVSLGLEIAQLRDNIKQI